MASSALVVKAGSCMNGGDGRLCALQPEDCPEGTSFVTPRMLEQGGGSNNAHGGACATRQGTEETAKIGSCPGEGCASDASACSNPSSFVSIDDRCTIRHDDLNSGKDTVFGKCGADNQCYWSSADCWDLATWNINDYCICENVLVGACLYQSFYYCAVDASACVSTAEWISATDLQNADDAPECFLCHTKETLAIQEVGLEPVPAPTQSTGVLPTVASPTHASPRAPASNRDSNTHNRKNIALGASLGGIGLAVLLVGTIVCLFRRRGVRTNKELTDIPRDTTSVSVVNLENEEEMSDIE